MKKKIIKIVVIVMMVFIAAAVFVTHRIALKNPVFIKNCREIEISLKGEVSPDLEIFYISSIFQRDRVYKVSFEEVPNIEFIAYDSKADCNKSGINEVRLVKLNSNEFKDKDKLDGKIISNAKIEFTSGRVVEADLGKILLYKSNKLDDRINIISHKSSSDGSSAMECKVKDNVKIEDVKSAFLEEVKDIFEYNIYSLGYNEDTKVFEEQVKGSMLIEPFITFSAKYICSDIEKNYIYYDVRPEVHLINTDNESYSFKTYEMSNRNSICYADNYELYKYLKMIGEI